MSFKPKPWAQHCQFCSVRATDVSDCILFGPDKQSRRALTQRDRDHGLVDLIGFAACAFCRVAHYDKSWAQLLELATVHAVAQALTS